MASSLGYRKEIDGLRAISVIAVIIFHAEFTLGDLKILPGGFLGVDVFFVLSGYLISRILLNELHTEGSLSFRRFYRRRARRLLPMLLTVVLVCLPIAWFRLLPDRLVEFAKSIIAALFFVANFFFYSTTSAYGAADSNLIPLLNTWSLGIEEQFYLVIPPLLLLLYGLGMRRFTAFFVVLSSLSFIATFYFALENPNLNFYSPITRTWELLAGAIVAQYEIRKGALPRSPHASLISAAGISMVIASFFVFEKSDVPHPGPLTFCPCWERYWCCAFVTRQSGSPKCSR